MEELPDFTCEMPGCLETFYSQCDKCCKKSFCKDHLDNHYSVDISQSQSSVIPEESASGVHSVIKSSDIMNHCTKVQLEIKKGKNKGNISMISNVITAQRPLLDRQIVPLLRIWKHATRENALRYWRKMLSNHLQGTFLNSIWRNPSMKTCLWENWLHG